MVETGKNTAKGQQGAKKSGPAATSKVSATAAKPATRLTPKPEPATVNQVTSATKVKSTQKPADKPTAKAASKGAAPEKKAAPAKAISSAEAEPDAAQPVLVPVPDPAPEPPKAAAPVTHAGIPAGPMRPMTPPRAMAKAEIFVDGDFVVYPTHGVGKVERIATEEIAGHTLELIHITFDENRMTLRVPTNKARTAGLRKLASRKQFDEVLATLKGRARIKRTMWSRRAQEYEAKINSGDPSSIAEVVRDLHRNAGQPDQSFSERQIYESALDRLAAEYGALEQVDKATATERLIAHLKSE
jgi:CarD family transcriptional regulator